MNEQTEKLFEHYLWNRDTGLNYSYIADLINAGANIDHKGPQGKTLLMIASASGDTKLARLLYENHADVKAKDINGKSVYDYILFASDKKRNYIASMIFPNDFFYDCANIPCFSGRALGDVDLSDSGIIKLPSDLFKIAGNLLIENVPDFESFGGVEEIEGKLSLDNVQGIYSLGSLKKIKGTLYVVDVPKLRSLGDLEYVGNIFTDRKTIENLDYVNPDLQYNLALDHDFDLSNLLEMKKRESRKRCFDYRVDAEPIFSL